MKNLLCIAAMCLLVACSKTEIAPSNVAQPPSQHQREVCDFGKTEFNLAKRAPLNEEFVSKRPQGGGGGGGNPPPPTANPGVILVDFDGHVVSNTQWNSNGPIVCLPANLSSVVMGNIVERMKNDFAPFYITVTTDEAVYNAANPVRRTRVILTETWEPFGQSGGIAFLGSMTWGDNTPCFVFSSLLNYSEKHIAEAASHETGHTLGLRHQAVYNGTTLINQYNYGVGDGEIGWAPIMGVAYNRNMSTWHNGPTNVSSTSLQNDAAIIGGLFGLRSDDYSNTSSGAATLNGVLNGSIHSSSDVDFFSVNLSNPSTLTAAPFNVGANNVGANLDLVIKIYTTNGQLINTINDPSLLHAGVQLNGGQYFVSVSVAANQYASTYGQLSQYTIGLN